VSAHKSARGNRAGQAIMFRLDHHCPWWSAAPGPYRCRRGPALARTRLWWGVFRAQAAPWCLRRHDLQRPLWSHAGDAQARSEYRTRLRLCDAPHGASNLRSHSGHAAPRPRQELGSALV